MSDIDPRPSLFDNEDDLVRNLPCADVVHDFKFRILPYVELIQFNMKKLERSGQFTPDPEFVTSAVENCTKLIFMLDSYVTKIEADYWSGIDCKSIL